jgi:hypothetical protein
LVITSEVGTWLDQLSKSDSRSANQVFAAFDVLEREGPMLGRPLVDSIKGSQLSNLKELRPGSAGGTELRILFVFDPRRQAVLLVAGDKAGDWSRWYVKAIKEAESRYSDYLAELAKVERVAMAPRQRKRGRR